MLCNPCQIKVNSFYELNIKKLKKIEVIHKFLSTYYVPGTIISTKDHQNRQENSCSHKAHILGTKTIKLLEKNVGGKLHDIGYSNNFLDRTTKVQQEKEK